MFLFSKNQYTLHHTTPLYHTILQHIFLVLWFFEAWCTLHHNTTPTLLHEITPLYHTALHYNTLHYILPNQNQTSIILPHYTGHTIHYTTLHYTTLHHYITLNYKLNEIHHTRLDYDTTQHNTTWHNTRTNLWLQTIACLQRCWW